MRCWLYCWYSHCLCVCTVHRCSCHRGNGLLDLPENGKKCCCGIKKLVCTVYTGVDTVDCLLLSPSTPGKSEGDREDNEHIVAHQLVLRQRK